MKSQQSQTASITDTPGDEACAHVEPTISVLIVGYHTKDLVLDCLAGLYRHTSGPSFEVLYTDCSNDGSEQAIRDLYPMVRVIENDENLGFGRGNNFLARHARGAYLLLLNPDTLIQDNAVGWLYDFARATPAAGAWGGVTRLPNGEIDPGCQQAGPELKNALLALIGMASKTRPDVEADRVGGVEVASLSGAFMMLPRDVWQELGGFDESFFMYCEETDLCWRIRKTGRKVLITPHCTIIHLVGSGSAQNPKRMLALTRGGMHLARKHHGPLYVHVNAALRWLHSASRYTLGVVGIPLIGRQRAAQLRSRHAPIICKPGQWFGGWNQS